MTDEVTMDTDELVKEIDAMLQFLADNSIGEYVKIDDMSDVLLDFRQKVSSN